MLKASVMLIFLFPFLASGSEGDRLSLRDAKTYGLMMYQALYENGLKCVEQSVEGPKEYNSHGYAGFLHVSEIEGATKKTAGEKVVIEFDLKLNQGRMRRLNVNYEFTHAIIKATGEGDARTPQEISIVLGWKMKKNNHLFGVYRTIVCK